MQGNGCRKRNSAFLEPVHLEQVGGKTQDIRITAFAELEAYGLVFIEGNGGELIVTAPVKPRVEHPLFWEWDTGILTMLIADRNASRAADRAARMIQALPYEWTGQIAAIADELPKSKEAEAGYKLAGLVGLVLWLDIAGLGEDNRPRLLYPLNPPGSSV